MIVIDVRSPEEYVGGHVKGALNIPPDLLLSGADELKNITKDTPIIVYCRTGTRSEVAKNILTGLGFTDITNGINKQQVEAKYGL
jgi:rhodanese-related sulfurtransferase